MYKKNHLAKRAQEYIKAMLGCSSKMRWNVLSRLIIDLRYTSYAEIGVYTGKNAFEVIDRCPQLERVILVDPYNPSIVYHGGCGQLNNKTKTTPSRAKALAHWRLSWCDAVAFVEKESVDAAKGIANGSLDVVFIDAQHDEKSVAQDIHSWWPKVKLGGLIAGHDYDPNTKGAVATAVNAVFPRDVIELFDDAVWVVRKKEDVTLETLKTPRNPQRF